MYFQVFIIFTLIYFTAGTTWDSNTNCPSSCICQEEHFFDLAIARYTRHTSYNSEETLTTNLDVSNDVFYDDHIANEENMLLRIATCFVQAETNLETFIESIPKDTQALNLVKSSDSYNKTLRTSDLNHFDELIVLNLQGSDTVTENSTFIDFVVEIDAPIPSLKYLNFDKTKIKNSLQRNILEKILDETENVIMKFEPVTIIKQEESDNEILPYYKYKQIQKDLESPILVQFSNLVFVRICSCNLQTIYWQMFDGLQNLKYLYLENNNLKFIPNFAFYGTPNLKTLSLASNNLLNIQIMDLAGLLELEYLDLSHNNFSQLSELSFPPFPKLKVADFRDNPITTVYPNTFDIMNTTDSIVLGSQEIYLQLLPNSFLGLNKLLKLTINNVDVPVLTQEMLTGMPELIELILTGNITKIQYDAFIEVKKLEKLILNNCNIFNISMDAFYGLENLLILDLSKNHLKFLSPNTFDEQTKLKELLLNDNEFTELPSNIFANISPKLIRLNNNPWHCSCQMKDWNPMIINKIKKKLYTSCDARFDKGIGCIHNNKYTYVYENRVTPKCTSPKKYQDFGVFQVIKRHLQCKILKKKLPNINKQKANPISKSKLSKTLINVQKNSISNDEIKRKKVDKPNSESNYLWGNYDNPSEYDLKNDGIINYEKKNKYIIKNKQFYTPTKIKKFKKDINFDSYIFHKEM